VAPGTQCTQGGADAPPRTVIGCDIVGGRVCRCTRLPACGPQGQGRRRRRRKGGGSPFTFATLDECKERLSQVLREGQADEEDDEATTAGESNGAAGAPAHRAECSRWPLTPAPACKQHVHVVAKKKLTRGARKGCTTQKLYSLYFLANISVMMASSFGGQSASACASSLAD
jgi:hypothetical protein